MRNLAVAVGALCAVIAMPSVARADRTFLVGGTVIEGTATRKGSKVIIEVESGQITLPADSVARIEKGESTVSRYDERYHALAPGDAKARLELADYCRDHDMRGREHALLLEVLEIDGQNAAARTRLGYVKTDAGWVTQADAMRAKGLVQHEGQWVSPSELREIERRQADIETAARKREEDDAELHARRAQLDTQQAELDAQQSRLAAQSYAYSPYFSPYYSSIYPFYRTSHFNEVQRRARPAFTSAPFDSTSLSVVKVPYRHP